MNLVPLIRIFLQPAGTSHATWHVVANHSPSAKRVEQIQKKKAAAGERRTRDAMYHAYEVVGSQKKARGVRFESVSRCALATVALVVFALVVGVALDQVVKRPALALGSHGEDTRSEAEAPLPVISEDSLAPSSSSPVPSPTITACLPKACASPKRFVHKHQSLAQPDAFTLLASTPGAGKCAGPHHIGY